ncbi:MAG: NAD(+) synthase [Candidatus Cryptobacteroides sp.]
MAFIRVAACSPLVRPAAVAENSDTILNQCRLAAGNAAEVIVFPELSLCGYSCEELFNQASLYTACEKALEKLLEGSREIDALIFVGLPVNLRGRRYNCAAALRRGRLLGIVPKTYLPNNGEFYEGRYFESAENLGSKCLEVEMAGQNCPFGTSLLFALGQARVGVEICQDLWVPIPPCTFACLAGANLMVNLSASNDVAFKQQERQTLLSCTSSRLHCGYIYCSSGFGESSDDLVWAGCNQIWEDGRLVAEQERFQLKDMQLLADLDLQAIEQSRLKYVNFASAQTEIPEFRTIDCGSSNSKALPENLQRNVDKHPFFPGSKAQIESCCREVFDIQVNGLATRLKHIGCRRCVIGVSGGLDSSLALLVCCEAFDRLGLDRKDIVAVTMPCFGTSERTRSNALELMDKLGVQSREINISRSVEQHLQDIGHDISKRDVCYENAQARERTQVLMDLANDCGGIVVGTGDLSEIALGWCTFNGDHMSMYSVNAGVPKTLVREITRWRAQILGLEALLGDIIDTPVSPELIPGAQLTEDLVGPYELHDFFLWHFFRGLSPAHIFAYALKAFGEEYTKETVLHWLKNFYRRFFAAQFKRSSLPNGPKTCKVGLSPRGDWRMPSDASRKLWEDELNSLNLQTLQNSI